MQFLRVSVLIALEVEFRHHLFISMGFLKIIGSKIGTLRFKDLRLAAKSTIGLSEGDGSLGITSGFTTLLLKFATTVLSVEGGKGWTDGWMEGKNGCFL